MTWPVLLDYTRDECKRLLRKIELEAYASIVSAFRAQGELTKEKKRILQELCTSLSISVERHRAEIRRAVNDEKLGTIAERMFGPNTSMEWAVEGRRLIPLMPRLVPQTAFTALANNLADLQASKNAAMPVPSATGRILKLESLSDENTGIVLKRKNSISDSSGIPVKIPAMMPSPTSNMPPISDLIQLSPILSPQQTIIVPSSPTQSIPITPISTPLVTSVTTHPSSVAPTQSTSTPSSGNVSVGSQVLTSVATSQQVLTSIIPMTVSTPQPSVSLSTSGIGKGGSRTVSTTVQRPIAPAILPSQATMPSSKQQVILLSGSGGTIPPSILQRCLSVPVVKGQGVPAGTPISSTGTVTKIGALGTQTLMPVSLSGVNTSGMMSQLNTGGNMVVYTTTSRGRGGRGTTGIRQAVVRPRPSLVVPIQQQAAAASGMHASSALIGLSGLVTSQQTGNLVKTTGRGSRGKNTGTGRGIKLGPQMMMLSSPNTTSTRILPKPSMTSASVAAALGITSMSQSSLTSSLSSPLVVMGNPSLQATMAKGTNMAQGSPRIVNVMSVTPAPTRILPPANTYSVAAKFAKMAKTSGSNIVTYSPSATTTSISSGTGAKPNVIVVHKAPPAWPQNPQQHTFGKQTVGKSIRLPKGATSTTVSKILASMSAAEGAKRTTSSPIVQSLTTSANQSLGQQTSESFDATQLDPSNLDPKNTLLADLIQAAGIVLPEGTTATMPVTASSFKPLPSNIASSSLRKMAGLRELNTTSASSSGVSGFSKKVIQSRATPKFMKQNVPVTKKVITQTIPKFPPSITITQQSDSDMEDIPLQKVSVEQVPQLPVKVTEVPVSMSHEKSVFKSLAVKKDIFVEKLKKAEPFIKSSDKLVEETVIEESIVELPPDAKSSLETSISVETPNVSFTVETTDEPTMVTYQSEVFTADITPDTSLVDQTGSNLLQPEVFTAQISEVVTSTDIQTVETEAITTCAGTSIIEETVVMDSNVSTMVDESGNQLSFQAELPQLSEGQVFEIQAPESVIKLLASGHLTKEVLDLIQSAGIKFDGSTPLTLETTITEDPEKEFVDINSSNVQEATSNTTSDSFTFQASDVHSQNKDIEQSGSSLVEVYDSSGTMSLLENQIDLGNMQVVQSDNDVSSHLVLEQQEVLTEEISSEGFSSGDVNTHFVVGECITIEQQSSDLLVSEEVIGSSDMEVSTMETGIEQVSIPMEGEIIDVPVTISETTNEMVSTEITMDSTGTETMSLLEELMEQHKDNFN